MSPAVLGDEDVNQNFHAPEAAVRVVENPVEVEPRMIEVHRGITRTVVLVARWAIKLPSMRTYGDGPSGLIWSVTRGIQANLSEREWSSSPGACPVVWSLAGLVNVYPRCKPVIRELADGEYDGIGFLGPTDRKINNVGWLDGHLVWVDYDMSWNDCRACSR